MRIPVSFHYINFTTCNSFRTWIVWTFFNADNGRIGSLEVNNSKFFSLLNSKIYSTFSIERKIQKAATKLQ